MKVDILTPEMIKVFGLVAVNVGGEVTSRAAITAVPGTNFLLHDTLVLFQIIAAIVTALYVAVKLGQARERYRKERLIQLCPLNRLEPAEILEKLSKEDNGKRALLEECPISKMSEAELARIVKFSKEIEA